MELTAYESEALFENAKSNVRSIISKLDDELDKLTWNDMEVYATRLLTWIHICQHADRLFAKTKFFETEIKMQF